MALALIAASGWWFGQQAQGQVILKVMHAPGPSSRSPNYAPWLTNYGAYLETGAMTAGDRSTNPTALAFPPVLYVEDIMESTTNSLWLGVLNPENLAGERGNITPFGVMAESPQGLKLADLQVTLSSNDYWNGLLQNSLGATQRMNTITYSPRAVGFIWKDGVKGSPGGTRVTSGPATQVVNQIFYTGFARAYLANTQAEIDNIRAYISGQMSAFTITARWDLLGAGGMPVATAQEQWAVVPWSSAVRLEIAKLADPANVQVTVYGSPVASYTVQTAESLMGPWMDYMTVFNANNGMNTFTVPVSGNSRFYR